MNGKVLDISMVSDEHNDVSIFLMVLLRLWAEEHQAGVVRDNSFNMKTGPCPAGVVAGCALAVAASPPHHS